MRFGRTVRVVAGVGLSLGLGTSGCAKKEPPAPKEGAPEDAPKEAVAAKAEPVEAAEREASDPCKTLSPIYPTKGVHNPCGCGEDECVEERKPSDPPNPRYPEHWVSRWNMYRVFHGYEDNLPPYADPPAGLERGVDYELSHGATYYDDAYEPADGDGRGAMMEHYEKFCLPIFPIDSDFTCSFISLGNKAYFLTYDDDRPEGMPPCCLFSPLNHPPRPDFIKHLPYSAEDSEHLDDSLQAYRYIAKGPEDEDIWFAYAFWRDEWLDAEHQYQKPQSFYFSGSLDKPPDAPFVSQNYVDFRIERPDPAETWEQVAKTCPKDPPPCHLFDPPETEGKANVAAPHGAGWDDADFGGGGAP